MTGASPLLARAHDVERQDCTDHTTFYTCGNFKGCCPADPCTPEFMNRANPCTAAMESHGDGDGDGDDGGDGGDDETTSTTGRASTPTSMSSSTQNTETSTTDDTETFIVDTTSTSSSAGPSSSSAAEASTTTDGTTFTTSPSAADSTSGAAETLQTPTPTSLPQGESENDSLSRTAIAGVSIGGAVAGLAVLLLLFWLLRRRHHAKRMSSVRGSSPKPPMTPNEKTITDQRQSLIGTSRDHRNQDPFAEFGGAVQSPGSRYSPRHTSKHMRRDEGWPLCATSIPEEPSVYHQSNAVETLPSQQASQPTYELDSTETRRTGPDSGPGVPQSPSIASSLSRRRLPLDAQVHPSPLTPGFPGTQMAIQNWNQQNAANAPRDTPRATLNATEDERMNNQYANSWANGP
ncbi:hypothetical protein GGS24DRAFT_502878 [Hypoxylon argillaceum]|nr:hypothetical protein GGS24DRAFT_502878 [Hypoxylon argillaceum]